MYVLWKELTVYVKPVSPCKWDNSENFIELVGNPLKVMAHDFMYTHTHIHITHTVLVYTKLSINSNQIKEAGEALQYKYHTNYLEGVIGKYKMMKI